MKKYPFILIILLIFIACSDTDSNEPGIPQPEIPSGSIGNLKDGITVISDDSLGFVLFAPGKESVYLIGDFNDWQTQDAYKMNKSDDGRFWIRIGDLQKGREYVCQYLIDNKIRIADPYAGKLYDPHDDKYIPSDIYPNPVTTTANLNEVGMIVNTAPVKYSWQVSDFRLQKPGSMVIYEVLIRDFTEKRSIKGVQEKLDYIQNLGVNAIELMPFNEFEGNDSWGYNPSFYFATDKAYGTSNDYKAFIDECHSRGMAVIMDMVLNHSYGQSPLVRMYQDPATQAVTTDNPWYNVKSPNSDYSWGYDFNHESRYTQAFVDSVCAYWMKEYKVDGFRFDFTKGFTNKAGNGWAKDDSRIRILKRMTDEIHKRNPDAIVIFEHLTENIEEKELSDYGIYLWGNINYNFNEATMGWGKEIVNNGKPKGDVSWASYLERGWSKPDLVAYMESHDEERIMFKNNSYGDDANPSYNVKELSVGLKRTEAAAVILMTLPGPKMIWQFGELGYDYELNNDRLGKKPIRWDYFEVPGRKALYNVYAGMNELRSSNPVFSTADYTTDLVNNYKQILLESADGSVCAIANFDVVPLSAPVNFGKTGTWKDYFTDKTLNVSNITQTVELNPGEYYLYFSE